MTMPDLIARLSRATSCRVMVNVARRLSEGLIGFVAGILLPFALEPMGLGVHKYLWGETVHIFGIGECQVLSGHPECQDEPSTYKNPEPT